VDALSEELAAGRARTAVLHLSRSPVEIAVMRAVKSAFDPAGILNPDALFPPGTG
jgi:glycolate oxidase